MANGNALSAPIQLSGKQFNNFREAVLHAFPNFDALKNCVRGLDVQIMRIVRTPANLTDQVSDLIEWAESGGSIGELIFGLRACKPGNPLLKAVEEELIQKSIEARNELEAIVVANPELFNDPDQWRAKMIQCERKICRIELPVGTGLATGFLISPNLLLTCHHVIEEFIHDLNKVRFRFGYKGHAEADGGVVCALANEWLVRKSPTDKLDYAILRLDNKVGDLPIGNFQNAPNRGWLPMKTSCPVKDQALFILQHPDGMTLIMANGRLKQIDNSWLHYDVNTKKGSSGSPIFDNTWSVVGLHSRESETDTNAGTALKAILSDLPEEIRQTLD